MGTRSFNNLCFLLVSADEEFDELCFEYGLELDEIVSCFENEAIYTLFALFYPLLSKTRM